MIRRPLQLPGSGVAPVRLNRSSPHARGLQAWWPLCDAQSWGNSYNVYDYSGNNNTAISNASIGKQQGSSSDAYAWSTTFYGGIVYGSVPGLYFPTSRTTACLEVDACDTLADSQAPLTMFAWVLTYDGDRQICSQYEGTTSHEFKNDWMMNSSKVQYSVSTAAGGKSDKSFSVTLATYQWACVAVVVRGDVSGGVVQLFVNGKWSADLSYGAMSTSVDTGSIPLVIGGNADGGVNSEFYGVLRDLRIWNRALPKSEVERMYKETSRGTGRPPYTGSSRGVTAEWGLGSLSRQYRPLPRATEAVETTAQSAPIFLATTQAGL